MRDVRNKFFLQVCSLLPRLFQCGRDFPSLGQILHQDGKAPSRTRLVLYCCNADTCPELLPVPPDMPSLSFCPAGLQSFVELSLRQAIANIFRIEDAREMPAHDFVFDKTQQAVCSAIPAGHAPVRPTVKSA